MISPISGHLHCCCKAPHSVRVTPLWKQPTHPSHSMTPFFPSSSFFSNPHSFSAITHQPTQNTTYIDLIHFSLISFWFLPMVSLNLILVPIGFDHDTIICILPSFCDDFVIWRYNCFSANLAMFISVQRNRIPFNNLDSIIVIVINYHHSLFCFQILIHLVSDFKFDYIVLQF